MRFRIPEVIIGILLTVAVFAMGATFHWTGSQPSQTSPAQKSENADNGHPPEGTFGGWITHDAAGFFTLWLVVVGLGQAGLFFWQLLYMRRGMDDAKIAAEAARTSAETAKVQAETAKATLQVMQDTAKRQLRAYVGIVRGRVVEMGGGIAKIRIDIKNSGQTPAYKFRSWSGADGRVEAGSDFPVRRDTISRESTLGPGADHSLFHEYGPLTGVHVAMIQQKRAAIWTWGEIFYEDAFGEEHRTWFRLLHSGRSPPNNDGAMQIADEGNGSD